MSLTSKKSLDKYYTKKECVDKCIELFKEKVFVAEDDICIEPSAGSGAFIEQIKSIFSHYKFYDIQPENKEISKQDYLELSEIQDKEGKIHILGNPPFGRQSSLAIKFIKKSSNFCDTISFILPKSFKKDSLKKHFPLSFHLILEYDLSEDSFTLDGESYNVPCVFQIWEKKNKNRVIPKKPIPKNFSFVKKEDNPDISFRRVGVYAGKIDKSIEDKSIQSHYFIKFDKEISEEIYNKLSKIQYTSRDDTVGPRSISKSELITQFNLIV